MLKISSAVVGFFGATVVAFVVVEIAIELSVGFDDWDVGGTLLEACVDALDVFDGSLDTGTDVGFFVDAFVEGCAVIFLVDVGADVVVVVGFGVVVVVGFGVVVVVGFGVVVVVGFGVVVVVGFGVVVVVGFVVVVVVGFGVVVIVVGVVVVVGGSVVVV